MTLHDFLELPDEDKKEILSRVAQEVDQEQSSYCTASTKIGFPHMTGWISKRPFGWNDLGETKSWWKVEGIMKLEMADLHALCKSRLHIGRDFDGTLFKYCPRCLTRL